MSFDANEDMVREGGRSTGVDRGAQGSSATPPDHAAHSRFVQRVRRRYAAELALLAPGAPNIEGLTQLLAALRQQRELASALRVLRQLVLERLAVLDLNERAPLAVVTGGMTLLAEFCLGEALAAAQAELQALHGVPRNAEGQEIAFWVLGMGKLGARELNVSSDIDLVYVYEEEGDSDGRACRCRPPSTSRASGQEASMTLIGDIERGRPGVPHGPGAAPERQLEVRPACSLAALEAYFIAQGREWERLAWLKSRVVAPRDPETR
jgi:glutamate-ammonia-ligase adenylyltransferase